MGRVTWAVRACCAAGTLLVAPVAGAQGTAWEEPTAGAVTMTLGYGTLDFSRPRGGAAGGVSIERARGRFMIGELGLTVMRPQAGSGHRAYVAEYGLQWQVPHRRFRPYIGVSAGLAGLENLEPDAWPAVAGVVGAAIGGRFLWTSRFHVRAEVRARRFPAGSGSGAFHGVTGLGIRF